MILLEIRDLKKYFPVGDGLVSRKKGNVKAVDGVNLTINEGETVGLVGESGCGKSTLGRTILRLLEPTAGEIEFDGVEPASPPPQPQAPRRLRQMRKHMQIVFQDSVGSLDPRMKVGDLIAEGLGIHDLASRKERDA